MLQTTAKLHYNFGVRDLSCISQGIMMFHRDVENEPLVLAQLWKHECTRVLNDKLNMAEDKMWYDKLCYSASKRASSSARHSSPTSSAAR